MDPLTEAAHIAHESVLAHTRRQAEAAQEMGDMRLARAFWTVYAKIHKRRPQTLVEEMEREAGLSVKPTT